MGTSCSLSRIAAWGVVSYRRRRFRSNRKKRCSRRMDNSRLGWIGLWISWSKMYKLCECSTERIRFSSTLPSQACSYQLLSRSFFLTANTIHLIKTHNTTITSSRDWNFCISWNQQGRNISNFFNRINLNCKYLMLLICGLLVIMRLFLWNQLKLREIGGWLKADSQVLTVVNKCWKHHLSLRILAQLSKQEKNIKIINNANNIIKISLVISKSHKFSKGLINPKWKT